MSQANEAMSMNIYDPKLLLCKDNFDTSDICGICQNICNTATCIGCKNGDIFCKKCIDHICNDANSVYKSKQNIKCPSCAECVSQDKINVNQYAIKSISKYTIRCIFCDSAANNNNDDDYDEGKVIVTEVNEHCPWTGKISDALHHIESCEFAIVACKHCRNTMRRNKLSKHELDCTMLPIKCLLKCNKMVIRTEMNKHMEFECMEAYIKCKNKECNETIQRKNIKQHRLDCKYNLISCKFYKYGCVEKIYKKDIEKHMEEKRLNHLEMKVNRMEKTINSLKTLTTNQEEDFAIIFESNDNNKLSSYICTVNIDKRKSNDYYTFSTDNIWIKNVDASYCSTNLKECNLYIDTDYNYNDSSDPIFDDIHSKHNVIIRVGGKNELPNIVYVVESGDYKKLPELNIPRYGCHSIYSKIYGLITVGGRTRKTHHPLSSFEVLCVTNEEEKENFNWNICSKQQCMSKARCVPSLCLLNNKLVVCGGSNDNYNDNGSKNPAKKSCEIFDNDVRKWSFLSNMNNEYCAAGICTIDNSQKIAIAVDYHAELYDSHKNKWFAMPNMKSKHTLYPLLFMNKKFNDTLIIIGNDGTSKNISKWGDIEFIDLRQKSKGWMKFSSLPEFLKFDKYDCRNRYFQQICKLN